MRILSIALLMFISAITLITQEKVNYSGKIIDYETKLPIELVAIYTNSMVEIRNASSDVE